SRSLLAEQLLEELDELGMQVLDDRAADEILRTAAAAAPLSQPREVGKEGVDAGRLAKEEIPEALADGEGRLHSSALDLQAGGLSPDCATVLSERLDIATNVPALCLKACDLRLQSIN